MNKNKVKTLALALGCGLAASAQAGIINPGFEDSGGGGLTGWTTTTSGLDGLNNVIPGAGTASVVGSAALFPGYYTAYSAQEGQKFVSLSVPSDWDDNLQSTSLSQKFSLHAGDKIIVWAAIDEYAKVGPNAKWTLTDKYNNVVEKWDVSDYYSKLIENPVGAFHTPWESKSFTFSSSDEYLLTFNIEQPYGDQSNAYFDVQVVPVPEPSTLAAGCVTGLIAGFSFFRQSKRQIKR